MALAKALTATKAVRQRDQACGHCRRILFGLVFMNGVRQRTIIIVIGVGAAVIGWIVTGLIGAILEASLAVCLLWLFFRVFSKIQRRSRSGYGTRR